MSSLLSAVADALDPLPDPEAQFFYCWKPECDGKPHDGMTYEHARWKQHPPQDDWFLWYIQAGRGFGKTRTGAEWLTDKMKRSPDTYWALVAPTFDDGRDTMVEGESGLEYVLDRHKVQYNWNRSLGQLILKNGARLDLFSSMKPDALRGPNLTGAWGDEPATWVFPESTWTNLLLMTRKGNPQIMMTGTPRPNKFVKKLKAEADHLTLGHTNENRSNLAEKWYERVIKPLEGTRLYRQEVMAEILEDTEGALWTLPQIDFGRLPKPKKLDRVIISVDPSVSDDERDECGIVIGGRVGPAKDGHVFVLADWSAQLETEAWARLAISAYHDFGADELVAETNNGGDLVGTTIRLLDPSVNFRKVTASRGKTVRAAPVAAMYGDPTNEATWQRARMHHVGVHAEVEEEMSTWVEGDKSPNRMDALVWLGTGLLVSNTDGRGGLRYRR